MFRTATKLQAVVATAILLSAGMAAAAGQPRASAPAPDSGGAASEKEARLSLREVAVRVEAEGYRDIEEIEREGESYEVCAEDKQGREVELTVNARTGRIEKVEPCDD